MELLIKNADIVDGTGRAARKGSIGVVNGKIILDPAQDTADLVRQMEKFISLSHEKKKQMGLNARKKVECEFDRNIVVNAYLKAIKSLVNQ